uniref:Uncharacterized protein n=2 Tax=viral metagenome TaxID=1070528 RepID=A0A6H1ZG38_9ZZZZ
MNIAITILLSVAMSAASFFGLYNNYPVGKFIRLETNLGTSLTEIASTDNLADFPAIYNANLTALNAGKMEISTTTLPLLTTLANLATIGTITTGTWNATAIGVSKGGTGTTTLSSNQVLLGNTTSGFKTVDGWGTSNQILTSNGGVLAPTWQTYAVDQTGTYFWTGLHTFSATTTLATTTISGYLGLATTTPGLPGLQAGISVGADMYLSGGGLGIGIATTTDDNLEVVGDILFSGKLFAGLLSTTSQAYTGPTADDAEVEGDVFCPSGYQVISGGFVRSEVGEPPMTRDSYPLNSTTWRVVVECSGISCNSNTFNVYALCAKIY